ncbi:uncharacterized protein LOC135219034, partial [Macrobrachium nipponense]|uniref:uncharacterized protein LOC135219034 n=1 Tax=Macrobrachium nipponense TaxID=159736 RepID=UPI0030C834C6
YTLFQVGRLLPVILVCLPTVLCLPANVKQQQVTAKDEPQEAPPLLPLVLEVGEAVVQAAERIDQEERGGGEEEEKQQKDPITPEATIVEPQQATDDDYRLRRSPDHFFFQIMDFDHAFRSSDQERDIPFKTRSQFTPPEPRSAQERRKKYALELASNKIETGAHAIFALLDEPFFDEFDHAKAMLSLESRRKKERLPLHFLKSLRPFFPFYSKY